MDRQMNRQFARAAGCAALYLSCAAIAAEACAGSFQVTPIRLELSAAQRTGALTVRNDTPDPLVLQIELSEWSQRDGQDTYAATPDLLATPPIVTIAAGREQVFRVGLRRAPDPTQELAYRVFLQEVVPPPAADFKGLQVALRVGVPAFVKPVSPGAKPVTTWSGRVTPDGKLTVAARNNGNAHLQVIDFKLTLPDGGAVIAGNDRMSYVLADQSREWLLDVKPALPAGVTRLHLMAQTDAGPIEAELVLDQR
jgi:fimbrial chaperone protein